MGSYKEREREREREKERERECLPPGWTSRWNWSKRSLLFSAFAIFWRFEERIGWTHLCLALWGWNSSAFGACGSSLCNLVLKILKLFTAILCRFCNAIMPNLFSKFLVSHFFGRVLQECPNMGGGDNHWTVFRSLWHNGSKCLGQLYTVLYWFAFVSSWG